MSTRKRKSGMSGVSKRSSYVLKVKVEGPGVHKKSIPIPELVKLCSAIQSAVHRQAEAMGEAGRKNTSPRTNHSQRSG